MRPRPRRPSFVSLSPYGGDTARGFTLVEVLAALIIFSIAIIGYIEGMGAAVRTQADLAQRQRAMMLAENVMEEMSATGELEEGSEEGQFEEADSAFHWETEVTLVTGEEAEGLYGAGVTIWWGEGPRRQEVRLATLLLPPGDDGPLGGADALGGGGGLPGGRGAPAGSPPATDREEPPR